MERRHERYWTLIMKFHAMKHCPNLNREDGAQAWLEAMWTWMQDTLDPHMDHGVKWACIFLLNVWAPGNPGRTGVPWPPFDVFIALASWDDSHKAAFAMWCMNPVRP